MDECSFEQFIEHLVCKAESTSQTRENQGLGLLHYSTTHNWRQSQPKLGNQPNIDRETSKLILGERGMNHTYPTNNNKRERE